MNRGWREPPFFEIQETEGGHGTILSTYPDEYVARQYWKKLKDGQEKPVTGGDVRLVQVIEVFGDVGFARRAHVGWQIEDTDHPHEKNGLCVIHSTPSDKDIYNAWDALVDGTGEYADFTWNGNIKIIRIADIIKGG